MYMLVETEELIWVNVSAQLPDVREGVIRVDFASSAQHPLFPLIATTLRTHRYVAKVLETGVTRRYHIANARIPSIPIRLDLQQRKRAQHMRQIGRRRRVQIGFVELGEVFNAEQAQAPDHFVFEQLQHP